MVRRRRAGKAMAERRFPRWLATRRVPRRLVLVVVFWRWDWFIPLVQTRASAALGRPVTIAHLHVHPGGMTRIVADNVEVATRPASPPIAAWAASTISPRCGPRGVVPTAPGAGPRVEVQHPVFDIGTSPSGEPNWKLAMASSSGGPSVKIGELNRRRARQGRLPKLKADFALDIATASRAPAVAEQGQRGAARGRCQGHLRRAADHRAVRGRRDAVAARHLAALPDRLRSRTDPRTSRWRDRAGPARLQGRRHQARSGRAGHGAALSPHRHSDPRDAARIRIAGNLDYATGKSISIK